MLKTETHDEYWPPKPGVARSNRAEIAETPRGKTKPGSSNQANSGQSLAGNYTDQGLEKLNGRSVHERMACRQQSRTALFAGEQYLNIQSQKKRRATPHNLAADRWCETNGGAAYGFWAGLKSSIVYWAKTRQMCRWGGCYVLRVLSESRPLFFPDAWLVREAPTGHWATHQVVLLEVMHTSPISRQKLSQLTDLFWLLDEAYIELQVEVIDRTDQVARLDIWEHAACAPQKLNLPLIFQDDQRPKSDLIGQADGFERSP